MANNKFFDILNHITYSKKSYTDLSMDEKESINSFMLNRYLSNNPDYLELVNYVQFISYDQKEKYYRIYHNLIPKKKQWTKYIKSSTKNEFNKELLEILSKYYKCSTREVKDYIKILSKDDIKSILEDMAFEEKDIKKLLK